MDYKVKLTKCQNEHHHGDVFDTWTKWANPQSKRAQGPTDLPGFQSARAGTSLTRLYVGSQGGIQGLE
jgi:hypothetical protein